MAEFNTTTGKQPVVKPAIPVEPFIARAVSLEANSNPVMHPDTQWVAWYRRPVRIENPSTKQGLVNQLKVVNSIKLGVYDLLFVYVTNLALRALFCENGFLAKHSVYYLGDSAGGMCQHACSECFEILENDVCS